MEAYLNRSIKEVIKEFPPVEKILDEYGIGCGPCAAGLCLRKDIVCIHNLPADQEQADKFHHAKEEDILFKYFEENLDRVKAMCEDHKTARNHVKPIWEALERKDRETVVRHLNAYRDLLSQHIKREDEIMLPWMDKQLSVPQLGEMFSRFLEAEDPMDSYQEKYETFIDRLQKKYG